MLTQKIKGVISKVHLPIMNREVIIIGHWAAYKNQGIDIEIS